MQRIDQMRAPPEPRDLSKEIATIVDNKLNMLAVSMRYKDIVSACSFRDDPNPKYAQEALFLIGVRSRTWDILDKLEADVLAGNTPMPSLAEIMQMLPEEIKDL